MKKKERKKNAILICRNERNRRTERQFLQREKKIANEKN
jgi:hypothetical protein